MRWPRAWVDRLLAVGVAVAAGVFVLRTAVDRGLVPTALIGQGRVGVPDASELARLAESSDEAFGPADPAVTALVFFDYSCGWCREFEGALRTAQAKHPQHLRVAYRDFVLDTTGHVAEVHRAAHCAAAQDEFDRFHRAAFTRGDVVNVRNGWREIMSTAGVVDTGMAHRFGFEQTPSSFIGQARVHGSISVPVLDSLVASEINRTTRRLR